MYTHLPTPTTTHTPTYPSTPPTHRGHSQQIQPTLWSLTVVKRLDPVSRLSESSKRIESHNDVVSMHFVCTPQQLSSQCRLFPPNKVTFKAVCNRASLKTFKRMMSDIIDNYRNAHDVWSYFIYNNPSHKRSAVLLVHLHGVMC